MARRRKAQLELPVAGDSDTGAQVTGEAPATVPEQKTPTHWRVLKTAKVSLFGQLTTVSAGDVISAAGYGELGLARLREQVELEPVI